MKEIEISLEEAKKLEFEILKVFHGICEKENIRYSLAYGTLLGAVRHKGFIPWDDDVDVMVLREDFDRLCTCIDGYLENTDFAFISSQRGDDYFSPLPKMYDRNTRVYQYYGQIENVIIGVYIDVFIVDKLPPENAEEFYSECNKLRKKWGYANRKFFAKHNSKNMFRDVLGSIAAIPYRLVGAEYYRKKYDDATSKYKGSNSENAAVVLYGEGYKKEFMKISEFDSRIKVLFEGEEFYSVAHPEEYLTKMYGDFMTLPPEEKRISKHPNKMVKLEE